MKLSIGPPSWHWIQSLSTVIGLGGWTQSQNQRNTSLARDDQVTCQVWPQLGPSKRWRCWISLPHKWIMRIIVIKLIDTSTIWKALLFSNWKKSQLHNVSWGFVHQLTFNLKTMTRCAFFSRRPLGNCWNQRLGFWMMHFLSVVSLSDLKGRFCSVNRWFFGNCQQVLRLER